MTGVPLGDPKYFSHQVKSAKRFHILDRASKPLEIVSGGCEECGPDYDLRRIKFRHLVLALSAKAVFKPTKEFHAARHTLYSAEENMEIDKVVPVAASVKTKMGRGGED